MTRYACLAFVVMSSCWGQFRLPPGCTLPFDDIKAAGLGIDQTCTADGNAGDDTGKRLESKAKNNFCAANKPVTITFGFFARLQSAADKIEDLRSALRDDRSVLNDLVKLPSGIAVGEGMAVRFVGFLDEAHFSNVGKRKPPKKSGELVNCNHPEAENNDIHIVLMNDPNEDD